jgi:hypothetical protein
MAPVGMTVGKKRQSALLLATTAQFTNASAIVAIKIRD